MALTQSFIDVAEAIGDGTFGGISPAAQRKRNAANPAVMEGVRRVAVMLDAALDGSLLARGHLYDAMAAREVVSSSDITVPWALGVLIDRQIEQGYAAIEKQWPKLFTKTSVRNFRPKSIAQLNRGAQYFYDVPELTPYPMAQGGSGTEYFIQVAKTGIRYGWSFEARINDDLDQLMDVVRDFPNMAANTEDRKALGQIMNLATGAPATTFFNAGNNNLGQMKLTRESLLRVQRFLRTKRDPALGGIIPSGTLQLVVGPALEGLANAILSASRIELTRADGTKVVTDNPLAGAFEVTVNEKQIGSSWMVMPKPGTTAKSPLWFATLTGYEAPDYRYLANQGKSMGGGDLGPDDGSFDDDSVQYRARHICGATTGDPTLTYASDNTDGATEPTGMPTVADVTYSV